MPSLPLFIADMAGLWPCGIAALVLRWRKDKKKDKNLFCMWQYIFLLLILGIDLENIVYYKDDTHYFVMTAKKQSLLEKGVILHVSDQSPELSAECVCLF